MSDFQRARQPEQKEERRLHLLSTARTMLEGHFDLGELSLNELARQAGMAKSNVYRYFETREAVLLEVLWEEWAAFRVQLEKTWRPPARGQPALDALVHHLSRTIGARRLLCALITATPSVLERNLGVEAIRDFKTRTVLGLREMGMFLESLVPDLPAEQYAGLLYDGIAVVGGLYLTAYPSAQAARVVAEAPFKVLRRDFARDVERFLHALAHDRLAEAKPQAAARIRSR